MFSVLIAGSATDAPAGTRTEVADGHQAARYSEAGLAPPGSGVHAWISAHSQGARSEVPIAYRFTFSSASPAQLMAQIHRFDPVAEQKNVISFDAPPPGYDPPAPGATASTSACGYPISFGSNPGTATMEFSWEYRNTRDSNGDGTLDADPEWVLVVFSASDIELGTSAPPLSC